MVSFSACFAGGSKLATVGNKPEYVAF